MWGEKTSQVSIFHLETQHVAAENCNRGAEVVSNLIYFAFASSPEVEVVGLNPQTSKTFGLVDHRSRTTAPE